MDLKLPLTPQDPSKIPTYLFQTFRLITDSFKNIPDMRTGVSLINGQSDFATGLTKVQEVLAGLNDDPVAGACFISGRPSATPGNALLRVFTNAFALSATPINVWWVALGF